MINVSKTPITVKAGELPVTSSVGFAYCPHGTHGATEFLRVADQALYAAKAGRNFWRVMSSARLTVSQRKDVVQAQG